MQSVLIETAIRCVSHTEGHLAVEHYFMLHIGITSFSHVSFEFALPTDFRIGF